MFYNSFKCAEITMKKVIASIFIFGIMAFVFSALTDFIVLNDLMQYILMGYLFPLIYGWALIFIQVKSGVK